MVGLVLDAAGQQLGALDDTGSPYMSKPLATTAYARLAVEGELGDRQAALVAVLLLVAGGRSRG